MKTKPNRNLFFDGVGVVLVVVAVQVSLAWVRSRSPNSNNAVLQAQKWDEATKQMQKLSAKFNRVPASDLVQVRDRSTLDALLNPKPSKVNLPTQGGSPSPGDAPAVR